MDTEVPVRTANRVGLASVNRIRHLIGSALAAYAYAFDIFRTPLLVNPHKSTVHRTTARSTHPHHHCTSTTRLSLPLPAFPLIPLGRHFPTLNSHTNPSPNQRRSVFRPVAKQFLSSLNNPPRHQQYRRSEKGRTKRPRFSRRFEPLFLDRRN